MNATLDLAAFYALLAKTPREWELSQDGEIRRYLSKEGECLQCPISSLKNLPVNQARSVGARLGLSEGDATDIIWAADECPGYDEAIRTELLRACGLESLPRDLDKKGAYA